VALRAQLELLRRSAQARLVVSIRRMPIGQPSWRESGPRPSEPSLVPGVPRRPRITTLSVCPRDGYVPAGCAYQPAPRTEAAARRSSAGAAGFPRGESQRPGFARRFAAAGRASAQWTRCRCGTGGTARYCLSGTPVMRKPFTARSDKDQRGVPTRRSSTPCGDHARGRDPAFTTTSDISEHRSARRAISCYERDSRPRRRPRPIPSTIWANNIRTSASRERAAPISNERAPQPRSGPSAK